MRNEYAEYVFDWTFKWVIPLDSVGLMGNHIQETEYTIAGEISDDIFKDPIGGKLFGKTGFFPIARSAIAENGRS